MYNASLALSDSDFHRKCPAAFATGASAKVSDKFSFVPTVDVVRALQSEGWQPVWASQSRARDVNRFGFQKHMVRLRHSDATQALSSVGDSVPELVLVNAHDGTTAYQLHAGIFRLVCSNGMIVADGTFQKISLKHIGFDPRQAIEASFEVIKEVPRLMSSVDAMRNVTLSGDERRAFAESAVLARYDELEGAPIAALDLLRPRRYDDQGSDLWRTFNTVQENMLKGGVCGRSKTGRRLRTRAVQSISEDTRLNKALWHLAETLRQAKVAA